MNFTHFVSAGQRITPEAIPALCHDLLRRSAAMQLDWYQDTYDLLIPVYYGTEDEQFNPSNCGVIIVQVKNKINATTPSEIFEEDFNASPKTWAKSKTRKSERKLTKFAFNEMANPILFLLFDLGVARSERAPLVQVMHSQSGKQPDLWAIHSRGHDQTIFGCLEHMKAKYPSKEFFASVHVDESLADRLSMRNRTCHGIRRSFRYEGFGQGGGASAEESEEESEEASHIRSKGKDVEGSNRAGDFVQRHLPFKRRRSDRTDEWIDEED